MACIFNLLIFSFSLAALSSCSEDDCSSIERGVVTHVSGSEEIEYPSDITLTVHFYAVNGCGSFYEIEENMDDNTIYVEMKVKYVGCFCTQALVHMQEEYTFKPPSKGTYTFEFLNNYTDNITHVVAVN